MNSLRSFPTCSFPFLLAVTGKKAADAIAAALSRIGVSCFSKSRWHVPGCLHLQKYRKMGAEAEELEKLVARLKKPGVLESIPPPKSDAQLKSWRDWDAAMRKQFGDRLASRLLSDLQHCREVVLDAKERGERHGFDTCHWELVACARCALFVALLCDDAAQPESGCPQEWQSGRM
eukprot:GEMP01091939.1.p1 GENE.GEMP01091939.1~~GEMP01091939.1.p1  ORF type:complete len:176 (+),score=39.63 GEMP01091939.1:328-855(+)